MFAEENGRALVPGPLVRVGAGTEIRLSVRNSLGTDTLTFFFPSLAKGVAEDSLIVPPGEKRALRVRAESPGNYLYRARTNDWLSQGLMLGGLMAGAVVVDPPGNPPPADRVLVLLTWADSVSPARIPTGRVVFAINGRSWPHTERLQATVGDTVRWRVINGALEVHPMHLHGFYFRVDELTGPLVQRDGQGHAGRMVVTERMSPFSAMSVTWVPERAGNWLFHCHFQIHVVPHAPLDSTMARTTGPERAARRRAVRAARAGAPHAEHENHPSRGWAGW
jgi:FtsP/CotA-like multicopper oxidase with cupredoxin domain